MKICTKCKKEKELFLFAKDSKSLDKKQSWCKQCKSAQIVSYYKEKPEKRFKRTKEQGKERYNKNKINYNIARRIRKVINKEGNWNLTEILGYTFEEFKTHFEKLFTDKMTWENYREYWEIDHIKPISSFYIRNFECKDFKICWDLNNLQPLEKLENLKKGNKFI